MPGAKPYGFRLGDNAEILTEFIISRLAFTTRVPRTEDVGHDFLCSIAEKSGTIYKAGPFFTVQVKSNKEPLIFQKPHEMEWINSQENPFFICIADRPALKIELFSTWNMLNAFLYRGADKILLIPGEKNDSYQPPQTDETKSEQTVPLGKPILEISADQIADDKNVTKYASILRQWIEIDRINIVYKDAGMYWVAGPTEYETNEPIRPESETTIQFYWNPKNLNKCMDNFGRVATALRLVIRSATKPLPEGEGNPDVKNKIETLNKVIITFKDWLHPVAKHVLSSEIGLDFG